MTEAEWLACADPTPMLAYLKGKAKGRKLRSKTSERKLRLFACACCRRIWNLLIHERSRRAVEAAERFADGMAGREELAPFWVDHDDLPLSDEEIPSYAATYAARESAWSAAMGVPREASSQEAWAVAPSRFLDWRRNEVRQAAERRQAAFLRCIFGNPFRPSSPLPLAVLAWNDGTICRIAKGIYEDRAFDRMPILADALEESGCPGQETLDHCRQAGEHVRGCWVVDLLLEKG